MAKDPAVLWYWSDWQGGTTTFSRHLKGCYIDLLNAQFNTGRLSLEEIRTVLGTDFGQAWPTLQKKFAVDETGKYFNERMEHEKLRRKKFTDSRKKNLGKPHMSSHMESRMETANRNKVKEGTETIRGEVVYDAERAILTNQIEFERICMAAGKDKDLAKKSLRKYHLWLAEKEAYPMGRNAVYAGFERWLLGEKNQPKNYDPEPEIILKLLK